MDLVPAQGVAFVICALAGSVVGWGFDLYRASRSGTSRIRWLDHVLDVLFVLAALPVVVAALLLADWGALRLFALLALGIGMGLYFAMASPVVLPAAVFTFGVLHAFWRTTWAVLWWPVAQMVAAVLWVAKSAWASGQRTVGALRRLPALLRRKS